MRGDSAVGQGSLTPRARRFPIRTTVRYRASGEADWREGASINISSSGILFRVCETLPVETMLDMQIIFPQEVTGGVPANVECWGPVVRTEPPSDSDSRPAQAVCFRRYHFHHA